MQSSNNKYGEQDREESNRVQRQINQITNESLESTRRTLGLVVESDDIGKTTMVKLDEQDEKLSEIEVRYIFSMEFIS
jgi:esterase/lipase